MGLRLAQKPLAMVSSVQLKPVHTLLWIGPGVLLLLPFSAFLRALGKAWTDNPEFSYGILIPFIVLYLLWQRRQRLQTEVEPGRFAGVALAFTGCVLQVFSSMSGSVLIAGVALVMAILGTVLYLWGPRCAKIATAPVAILMLMIPLPGYVTGELSWKLQGVASTVSSTVLRVLGTPVLQEGNLLKLPNYVLEVKQACSGSRSLFALIALALVLGLNVTRKSWIRVLLVAVAPALAVGANVVRIVGTGLIARRWGALAADESLHLIWGILVFVIAVSGLLGIQRFLRWATNEYA
jgi:exosortase